MHAARTIGHTAPAGRCRPTLKMRAQSDVDIAVIGGGLGGLATAAGLTSRGFNVRVFEAAPALRKTEGIVISLGGNAFTALDGLHPGIVPVLKEQSTKILHSEICVRTSQDAEVQVREIPRSANESHLLRWNKLQATLESFVPEGVVTCDHKAVGVTEEEGCDWAVLHFKDQPDVRARLVIAADGIRSALRQHVVPQDPGPRYLGQVGWSGLVYNPDNSKVQVLKPGDAQIWMDSSVPGENKLLSMLLDASDGYHAWSFSVKTREPLLKDATGRPINQWGVEGSKEMLIQLVKDAGFLNTLAFVEATPEEDIFLRAVQDSTPLDELDATMVSKGGRVVLLGDAAHAMHPGPGQGGRTTFEDGYVLASLLEQHKQGLAGWKLGSDTAADGNAGSDRQALSAITTAYNEARLLRTCMVQRYASENCGIPEIALKTRPVGLDTQQNQQRNREFATWMNQFPANPSGDPQAVWFKPAVVQQAQQVAA